MEEPRKNRFCTIPAEDIESVPETWKGYLGTIKDTVNVLKWIWNTMDAQSKRHAYYMMLSLGIGTILAAAFPRLITVLYQSVPQHSVYYVYIGMSGIVACYLIRQVTQYAHEYAREWILGLNIGSLDTFITKRLFAKSIGQHVQEARLLNNANITKGRERTLQTQGMCLFEGFPAVFSLFLVWCLLWSVSVVASVIITLVIVIYVVWMLYLNYRVQVVCTPLDAESRLMQRHRSERWRKTQRVKTAVRENEEIEHTSEWFDDYIGRDRQFWLWYIRHSSFRRLVGVLGILVIILYGLNRMWNDASYIPYFFPLVAWSIQIVDNIWQIGNLEHNLHWNLPAIQSLIRALDLPPDVVNAHNAITLDPAAPLTITFKNVGHSYPTRDRRGNESTKTLPPVLRNISFTIDPGEKVALIGPSGVGKSTLFALLLRAYNYTSGKILVNNIPLEDIDLHSWASAIGYIPQKQIIWSESIRYNILYELTPPERACVTEEQLWAVVRLLKADFGERMINGLDTLVGEEGMELSGGQAQRLALCGVFLKLLLAVEKQARLMLIDEATSALDSVIESEVQEALETILTEEVTALFIAHRLSTVRYTCTKFIVIAENGGDGGGASIEAIGSSFEELYRVSPTFRLLADKQGIHIDAHCVHAVA